MKDSVVTDSEKMLLIALAKMAEQHLSKRGDTVCSNAESAGEHAILALAAFGLMETESGGVVGTWTEAGKYFLQDFCGLRV